MLFTRRFANFATLLKKTKRTPIITPLRRLTVTSPKLYFSTTKPAEKM
jgi:hypothetical protein